MMFGEEFSTRAYEHITECLRSGGDGVTLAFGKNIWEVLAERPEQCEIFQRAMTNSTAGSAEAIVEAYDFSRHRAHRRCRRRPWSPACLDPAALSQAAWRAV
jgi:hypothetical protein